MNKNLHKNLYLSRFKKILSDQNYIVVYQNLGLKTKESNNLKYYVNTNGLNTIHIKNNLLSTLLKGTKFSKLANIFEGSCIVCYGNNEFHSTKQALGLHIIFPQLIPLGAYLDGSYLSAGQFSEIRSIECKEQYHLASLAEIDSQINQFSLISEIVARKMIISLTKP